MNTGPARSASIRVTIGDAQPVRRLGMRRLLTRIPGVAVVGEAADGVSALALVTSLTPDLLLLDLALPLLGGLEVLRCLNAAAVPTRAILLGADVQASQVRRVRDLGGWSLLARDTASEVLPICICRFMQGQPWTEMPITSQSYDDGHAGHFSVDVHALTARELEIVNLVERGNTNKEIAFRLGVTEQAIRNHLRAIFKKCQVSTRLELALQTGRERSTSVEALRVVNALLTARPTRR